MFLDKTSPNNSISIPTHIKGLIFDMDGTLINSLPAHYKAWLEACNSYGVDFTFDYFTTLTGRPVIELSKDIITRFNMNISPVQLVKEKEALVEKNLNEVKLIQPVMRVIKAYNRKLPMAVGTGACKQMATHLLSKAGIINQFKSIITSDDVDNYKPHPETFLKAALEINVVPEECLVFEDGQLGIEAAIAAGMSVIDVKPFYE